MAGLIVAFTLVSVVGLIGFAGVALMLLAMLLATGPPA
jgi:hypothetical protein